MAIEDAVVPVLRFFGRMVARVVFELFLYWTARLLFPVFSLGRWHVRPLAGMSFWTWKWWERQPNGTIVFEYDGAVVLGFLFWAFVLALTLPLSTS
jgi:hypothetical protein